MVKGKLPLFCGNGERVIPTLPKELIFGPSPDGHNCFWIYPCQEEIHGKY